MGWLIFVAFVVYGLIMNILMSNPQLSEENSEERKRAQFWVDVGMWIGIAILGAILLYGLGWLWYYFCCGFLVFEDPSPGWKIIWGITSLIPLGFILGFIAICFGYNPFKD